MGHSASNILSRSGAAPGGSLPLRLLSGVATAAGGRAIRLPHVDEVGALLTNLLEPDGSEAKQWVRGPAWSPVDAADLYCTISRLNHRDVRMAALSRFLADDLDKLEPSQLPALVRTIRRGDACEEFVLLHGICRAGAARLDDLDGASVVALLQAFGRWDLFEEEFLDAASVHLQGSAPTLTTTQVCDAVYALGSLQLRDVAQLDALCESLRPRADQLAEADVVRFMRGLVKLRHAHETLLSALVPAIMGMRWRIQVVSLTNLISCFSFFDSTPEKCFKSLLQAATQEGKVSRLTPVSIQHILTALCRQQGRLNRRDQDRACARLCEHLTSPSSSMQLSLVQSVSSLAALARLQYRDLPAASVLTSVLIGRGNSVVWTWAKSVYFHGHQQTIPRRFDERRCLEGLQSQLQFSHYVEILQSLLWLDLHSWVTANLARVLCKLLVPHLHELRAKEVLVVARALAMFSAPALEGGSHEEAIAVGTPQVCDETITASANHVAPAPGPTAVKIPELGGRELAVSRCFENLRRHEHFLESSWHTLLPFKLLCLEIELGTFGVKGRLSEILQPMLLSFVQRLRDLSLAECEANRVRRERTETEEELPAAGGGGGQGGGGGNGPGGGGGAGNGGGEGEEESLAADTPVVEEYPSHRVLVGGRVGDLPVDILIEFPVAG